MLVLDFLGSVHERLLWLLHVREQYDRATSVRITESATASNVSMLEIYVSTLMCRQPRHNGKQHYRKQYQNPGTATVAIVVMIQSQIDINSFISVFKLAFL